MPDTGRDKFYQKNGREILHLTMPHHNIAILGAGMFGRTMALDLAASHSVTSFDISEENLNALKARNPRISTERRDLMDFTSYPGFLKPFDLVINGTSASLGGELPPLPDELFAPGASAYDMMYGKGDTTFNQWAKQHGAAHAYDGLGMLVGQAAESFMLWRGLRPGAKQILRELRKNLEGQ